MVIVGLTGGIASGKSTVSQMLHQLGAVIIDADLIAREIVQPGAPAWQEIKDFFGPQVILENGELNRKQLGQIVFHEHEKLIKLNEITHPRIAERIQQRLNQLASSACPVAIVDAALLIEAGWTELVDQVWLVKVEQTTQVQRLMHRDGLTKTQALERINSQMPLTAKEKFAHNIIDNSGSQAETLKQVECLYRALNNDLNS